MCAGSELKDTQGETLSIEGADIQDLQFGKGRFNDNHGKGFFNSLGMVTEAKKITKSEDCENDRHSYYWDKIKAPFVYAKGYLHNDEDHPNAKAAAAIIRNIHRNDVPLKMKASVEGGVVARGIKDPTRLARTKIHSVALTFTPANNATLVEPLDVDKSEANWEKDKKLIKSVIHLAETNIPSFRHIERHASANTIYENINKIQELAKSMGIEVEVRDFEPKTIMKNAVAAKISSNISKINSLVKALGDTAAPADNYQQNITSLKNSPTTPIKPLETKAPENDIMRVQNAKATQKTNQFKIHASKVMKNPTHMDTVVNSLKGRGIHQSKIDKIVSSIKTHVAKAEELDKGTIGTVVGGAAGAYATKNLKGVMTGAKIGSKVEDVAIKMKNKLKKALMAGYGGASAPTSNTGGGVLQSESLDDSKKTKKSETSDEFSYISCDDCGHEQVYMDHQVKCRSCKKNFSLSKLKNKVK